MNMNTRKNFLFFSSLYRQYRLLLVFLLALVRFTNVSRDQTVLEGSNLQLFCEASGSPVPNITWTRVFENGSVSQEVLHRGPTWNIESINRTNAGIYRCTAYNGIVNPVNHIQKVYVLCKYML